MNDDSLKTRHAQGFSLVELAVVLFIIGLLTAGGLSLYKGQVDQADYMTSKSHLNQAKQALLSYASVNGYLPCPDTNGDGHENRSGDACSQVFGELPHNDLGLTLAQSKDGFGHRLGYGTNTGTTDSANIADATHSASYFCQANCDDWNDDPTPPGFKLDTPPTAGDNGAGNLNICDKSQSSCTNGSEMALSNISAAIVAYNQRGEPNCAGRGTPEQENCNDDELFWEGNFQELSGIDGKFDDYTTGISGYEIKNLVLQSQSDSLTGDPFAPGGGNGDPTNEDDDNTPQEPEMPDTPTQPDSNFNQTIDGDLNNQNKLDTSKDNDSGRITGDLNTNINLGKGDDTIQIDGDQNWKITTNHGDNIILIGGNSNDQIKLGDGDDQVTIEGSQNEGDIKAGAGDNTIEIKGDVSAQIEFKEGDDDLTIGGNVNSNGQIQMGDGNNRLSIGGNVSDQIQTGEGSDQITIAGNSNGQIQTDKGDDFVYVQGDQISGQVDLGEGDDSFRFDGENAYSTVSGGDGDDTLYINWTESEWDALPNWRKSNYVNFETIVFSDGTQRDL
ncbi:MAG: prepilin-type N-terminal cleavage/methylation domain-containing protein [Hydrogenovibrio sp.]|uniref:prepilin-type N-terminal cleavage/methylation domain-containing protein n=1 Tax=Hydrogenovibrio sp. TaxID=2065821 RepID=UPI00286FE018|nr:prepilin-type N-terminal cleavage/methylation domain-containing protein [Hydrogenovibrio sp.]MDR9498568.1 prepilin-type N-terminal cleavage/methylation domain-containing protein [Hydrogenovibrio sp.]